MTAAIDLHNVEDAVDEIVRGVETAGSGGTWSVLGEPTAGKSAVLERLYDYFKQEGSVRPIVVTPPPRAYDAAHAALVDLAEGLELNQNALGVIQDPEVAWSAKLQRVGNALPREERVVLLLDEPGSWSPRETYFTEFVHDIWKLLFDRVGLTTVTAGSTPFLVRGHHPIHLDPASDPEAVLAAIDAPALAAAKDTVASGSTRSHELALTQEAAAEASGLHPVEFARAERGRRDLRISTLVKIATGLQVPAGDLLCGLPAAAPIDQS